jgi:hypothetical protein
MTYEMPASRHRCDMHRHALRMLLAIVLVYGASGCTMARVMISRRAPDPMAGAPRLQNSNIPSMQQVVAHINQNTDLIRSWKTNDVRIHAKGIAIPLSGR